MKNKITVLLALIFAFAFLFGFTEGDDYKYKTKLVEKVYSPCDKEIDYCTHFKLKYDEFYSGPQKDIINNFILNYIIDSIYIPETAVNKSIESLIGNFFGDYETTIELFKGKDYPAAPWELDIKGEALKVTNEYIAYSIGYYIFTGGAHPNTYSYYYNFNPVTGKVLQYSDVFKKGSDKKINELLEKKLRKFFSLSPTAPLSEVLFEDKLVHNDNFTINEKGITFLYNRYEIAAYVYGEIELELTYKEINNLLLPEFQN